MSADASGLTALTGCHTFQKRHTVPFISGYSTSHEARHRAAHRTGWRRYPHRDPALCTQPWVTKTTFGLNPLAEIGEYFCIRSDEEMFRQKLREPAGGVGR